MNILIKLIILIVFSLSSQVSYSQNKSNNDFTTIRSNQSIIIDQNKNIISKIVENTIWDKFASIAIPLLSLFISAIVVYVNYKQNKKKNEIEIISKARIQWINELRKIFTTYINNITMLSDYGKIRESYNAIKVYLNFGELAVGCLIKKMDFANKTASFCISEKEHFDQIIIFLDYLSKEKNSDICSALNLQDSKIDLEKLSNEELETIIAQIKVLKMNSEFKNTITTKIFEKINSTGLKVDQFKSDFEYEILELNNIFRRVELSKNYSTLKKGFSSKPDNQSIKYFLQTDLVNNIALSFYNYLKVEWEKVKSEVYQK